jgi:hypothetical protein
MSKTDRDRPVRVQITQGDRSYYAHHSPRCIRGEVRCTLPEVPTNKHYTSEEFELWLAEWKGRFYFYRVMCRWEADPYIGKHRRFKSDCGCELCTQKHERRRQRRRDRHNAKQQLRKEVQHE